MLEMLVYPVSAVMKFWHWILADVLSVPAEHAWVTSIILFVFTVRGIILPFAWQTFKVTRLNFLMRPHLDEVTKQYGTSTDPADLRAEEDARKQIQKDHGYNPLASCVPAMIQIPTFLGLYRVLLWMAVPDAAEGRRIGVLTDAEIESFRSTTFLGVPLPAYLSMTEEQFEFLGTNFDEVGYLAIRLIIIAIVFTSMNMLIAQLRSRSWLEWGSPLARRIYYGMYWVIPIVAGSLLLAGLTGRVPIALLMYWVFNNLFTTTQNAAFWATIVRKLPATDLHRTAQREAKGEVDRQKREKRELARATRRKRMSALANPSSLSSVRRELQEERKERRAARAAEKAEKKALDKERNAARKVMNKERAEELAAERKAKKAAKDAEAKGEPAERAGKTSATATGAASAGGSTLWKPPASS
ncbi:membrane protein insertase YidC [Corynebacterium sp. CNCTC7651]|uniref:membrane protein insertase YidC n=1 Tax=Corynebacterium sp. CNCTC7651 TaxID=2815361 RepID=UPI001F18ECB2|nr:membrane protein insertase YidC [Corynebacterium sp. CNCTC7651]UIZ92071.1 membrane protein insertase YidC [Corynebacterium sp. CNCTC7651]